MTHRKDPHWLGEAADQFNQSEQRSDGLHVAGCLYHGLTVLRDSLYLRVHHDVEKAIGADSMLMPFSVIKARQQAIEQIEVYQIAESAAAARELRYVGAADTWYLGWLARAWLSESGLDAELLEQSKSYLAEPADRRRLVFSDNLGRILPESRQAPLVLFRLLPLSIHIVTAIAFADRETAANVRRQQSALLPAIADCLQCRGRVLKCGGECPTCGNPLWKHEWLTAVD